MSITKRKYNKGYYVSHSHKRPEVKAERVVTSAKPENSEHMLMAKKENKIITTPDEKDLKLTAAVSKPVEIQKPEIKNSGAASGHKYTKNFFKAKPLEKYLPNKLYTAELKKKMVSASRDEDALSLLWIIIVILLLLYLIGLLAGGWGLGWAIHVLVIVAVVLLILWLLKIL